MLWLACEAAIIACDLAEVIGTAIALQLLFGIPLIGGALIAGARRLSAAAVLMNRGFRFLEAFVVALLIVICGLLCDPDRRRRAAGRARCSRGFCAVTRDRHQSGDALHRHRHHRRDGDAA